MKILIAEDDPSILNSLKTILEQEGFVVLTAPNGRRAFEIWESLHPDMVCLDIMMPEMDGYQVCRRIRAGDPHVPLLFLSAKSDETDVVVGLELGADDFIRKPFGKHEFLARIRAALRKRQRIPAPEACFSFGPMTIHPDELRAKSGTGSIDLSPREVAILKYFSEHAGKVVSRDALLNACWGINFFPESRTLDQQISRLRKKIETNPANPEWILTVHNAGYRHPAP